MLLIIEPELSQMAHESKLGMSNNKTGSCFFCSLYTKLNTSNKISTMNKSHTNHIIMLAHM